MTYIKYPRIPSLKTKTIRNLPYRAYNTQKQGAKRRGVRWYFTFENWVQWWETKLGPDWMKKRGKAINQYQMARKKDEGPYAAWNVECLLTSQNIKDRDLNGKGYLSGDYNGPVVRNMAKIEKLLLEGHTVHAVATKLGVSSTTIYWHLPKGVCSVMQKRGIKKLTVTRYHRDQIIEL